MVENLSQLKREIKSGKKFRIVEHGIRPEYKGQIRKPNVIQTNGFYSIVDNEPDNPITLANNRKGSWIEYGKASDWMFEYNMCAQYDRDGRLIWIIQFIE